MGKFYKGSTGTSMNALRKPKLNAVRCDCNNCANTRNLPRSKAVECVPNNEIVGEKEHKTCAFYEPKNKPKDKTFALELLDDDTNLISRIKKSKQGVKFNDLYSGKHSFVLPDGTPNLNSADFSFCMVLAFWTKDKFQIDRIYRSSELFNAGAKGRWDKKQGDSTYGLKTIENAISKILANK